MNPWTLGGWGQVLYCGPFFFVINRAAAAAADGTRLSSLYPAAQLDLLEFKDQTVGQESFDTIIVRWTLLEMNEINAAVDQHTTITVWSQEFGISKVYT